MALYAVFQNLGLTVKIRPVLPDFDELIEPTKYDTEDDRAPFVGCYRPGQLVMTERGGSDGDDPREWVEEVFGDQRPDITWITGHKWPGLGMIHLTVLSPPPPPRFFGKDGTSCLTNACPVWERGRDRLRLHVHRSTCYHPPRVRSIARVSQPWFYAVVPFHIAAAQCLQGRSARLDPSLTAMSLHGVFRKISPQISNPLANSKLPKHQKYAIQGLE